MDNQLIRKTLLCFAGPLPFLTEPSLSPGNLFSSRRHFWHLTRYCEKPKSSIDVRTSNVLYARTYTNMRATLSYGTSVSFLDLTITNNDSPFFYEPYTLRPLTKPYTPSRSSFPTSVSYFHECNSTKFPDFIHDS